jgi:hypothetical protein
MKSKDHFDFQQAPFKNFNHILLNLKYFNPQ